MEDKKIGIQAKLVAIMGEIGSLDKDKTNTMQNYNYLSETNVKHAVQPLLVKYGVLFVIDVLSSKQEEIGKTKTGNSMFLTTIKIKYKFIDTESKETVEGEFEGVGSDTGDKGLYKAVTGGIKYILTSTFLIPTGEDPENEKEEKQNRKTTYQPKPTVSVTPSTYTNGEPLATAKQKGYILAMARELYTPDQLKDLSTRMGILTVTKAGEVIKDFEAKIAILKSEKTQEATFVQNEEKTQPSGTGEVTGGNYAQGDK